MEVNNQEVKSFSVRFVENGAILTIEITDSSFPNSHGVSEKVYEDTDELLEAIIELFEEEE